jgi:CubicO group peptidase (beta-lactamase class C family)
MTPLEGTCAARFAAVRAAFADNFTTHGERGAALAVYVDGQPVVDLWGGDGWRHDTMAVVFSATKGATAACIHRLVEGGTLDLDAPVARYWPEFAAAGKATIPLRWVLSHRAGLPTVDATLSTADVLAWAPVCEAIAAQAPAWPPGSQHAYHVRTYGFILGEVVRRATGTTLGQVFAREIAAPLGLSWFIGLPATEESRVATLTPPPLPTDPHHLEIHQRFLGPDTPLGRALSGPGELAYGPIWNTPALHRAEIPSSNGIADARSVARLYAALIGPVDGVRLLRPDTLATACAVASDGPDGTLLLPTRFGLGFMLPPGLGLACGPDSFGHPGAGGSLGFADPARRLAVGYVTNTMQMGLTGDRRTETVVRAVYAALAG